LFLALVRRAERAYREYQLNHRPPVFPGGDNVDIAASGLAGSRHSPASSLTYAGSIGLASDTFETWVELREAASFDTLGEEHEWGAHPALAVPKGLASI
jgi:hypothetical protein